MARRDDRGAIIPMVSLMLVALIGISAFAVDLGMQRVARRDMQALADAVALDVARLLDGRPAGQVRAGDAQTPSLASVVAGSAARNDDHTLGSPPVVVGELVTLGPDGRPVMSGPVPRPVADDEVADGVLVTASTEVEFGLRRGRGGAVRAALAVTEPFACFALGSYALAVDAGDAAHTGSARLDELLEDALQVQGLGYHGLADASVSLAGIAAELGAASPDQLMGLRDLRVRDLVSAMATVLAREGGSGADVQLLQTLAARANSELSGRFDVADLLSLSTGGSAVVSTRVSVLDLLAASAFASDGAHALDVPVLWSVPKFSSGATSLQVVQRPQRACGAPGEVTARTAQLRFSARPILHVGNIAGLTGQDAVVQLDVELAGAAATLASITCGEGTASSPEAVTVDATRELSTASMTIPVRLTGSKKALDVSLDPTVFGLLSLLPNTQATFDLSLTLTSSLATSSGPTSATYQVPAHTYAEPEPIHDGTPVLLPYPTISTQSFTGTVTLNSQTKDVATLVSQGRIDLTPFVADLQSSILSAGVNPFLDRVNAVVDPTARLLGLHPAGADLYGVPRPTCDVPALRG